jgi:hypothetical protein
MKEDTGRRGLGRGRGITIYAVRHQLNLQFQKELGAIRREAVPIIGSRAVQMKESDLCG